ncbi:MAG: hypothetical protein N2D54_05635 [Chloroflexota bacterium]
MSQTHEFKPFTQPRRAEVSAWVMAIVVLIVAKILSQGNGSPSLVTWLLSLFFLISAASISFGNWLDANTLLNISKDKIAFKNGLRNVTFAWHEIETVQVHPSKWGDRVFVLSNKAKFSFQMTGQVTISGKNQQTGFSQGKAILETIVDKGGLEAKQSESNGKYYYIKS